MKRWQYYGLFLALVGACLVGCSASGAESGAVDEAAADYCAQSGGEVETRYPFYGTNGPDVLQLAGSMTVCTFTADDGSRILIALDTLYAEEPTLAGSAYRAQVPFETGAPSVNPSSLYCSQLGGTDLFGGINAAGGGWALEEAADVISLCVFADFSAIDSWGLTYHADDTIRGADLTDLLRYQPSGPGEIFP